MSENPGAITDMSEVHVNYNRGVTWMYGLVTDHPQTPFNVSCVVHKGQGQMLVHIMKTHTATF